MRLDPIWKMAYELTPEPSLEDGMDLEDGVWVPIGTIVAVTLPVRTSTRFFVHTEVVPSPQVVANIDRGI